MDNVERVCIICKKEDRGSGAWSYFETPSPWEQVDGLCPGCRQELFPEFGKGAGRLTRSNFKVGNIVRSVMNQFGIGANPTR